jgi:hypothetical protein
MCNCGKPQPKKNVMPQFKHVLTKDRLGRVITVKVPINPRRKRRQQMRKNQPQKKNEQNVIIPDIEPKIIENEIDEALSG